MGTTIARSAVVLAVAFLAIALVALPGASAAGTKRQPSGLHGVALVPGSSTSTFCPARQKKAAVFISPSGDDSRPCTRGATCRSLDRAYRVAARGDVVELAAGAYEAQSMRRDPAKTTGNGRVLFRPAAGAVVTIGDLTLEAGVSHVTLERLAFPEGWEAGPSVYDDGPPVTDVTFQQTTGKLFGIWKAVRVSVLGGSYGPSVDVHPTIAVYNPWNTDAPTDILVDGVSFHDFTRSTPDIHTECLQIYAGIRVTVRNSRFDNCDGTGSMQVARPYNAPMQDTVVEGNWFGPRGDGLFNVQTGYCLRSTFRSNVMTEGLFFNDCGGDSHGAVIGNTFPWTYTLCRSVVVYQANVISGRRCRPSDHRVIRRVVDQRAREFERLLAAYAGRCERRARARG